jgi:hypothetical protein
MKWDQKNLFVYGKVVNKSEIPIRNIHFTAYFLDNAMQILFSDSKAIFSDKEMAKGQDANFMIEGADLLNKVACVAYEIENVEPVSAPEPSPAPAQPGEATLAAPPASPAP